MTIVRGVSEVISVLALIGALTFVLAALLIIMPRAFSVYSDMATAVALTSDIPGYQTAASLSRIGYGGSTVFVIIIHNYGQTPVTVTYSIYCETVYQSLVRVGGQSMTIPPGSTRVGVHPTYSSVVKPCYAVVEEPNLLMYKVVES